MAPMLVALRSRYTRCSSNGRETWSVMSKKLVSIAIIIVLLCGGSLLAQSEIASATLNGTVSALPINGRNFLDFTLLTPGVSRDLTRYGDISFGGQRGTANSLLVDGSDSNNVFFGQSTGRSGTGRNPYSFSQDAVQEFQVSSNGYAAEVGRASGGVINGITQSGTNDIHGTAFEFYRDKALNANSWENNRN